MVTHDLDGYFAVEGGVQAIIYFCHAAPGDQVADLNFSESFTIPSGHAGDYNRGGFDTQ